MQHRSGAKSGVASGNNIQRLREAKTWSRPDLAKRMGTSPQQVERLEKGQRRLANDWIDKAAAALGVEPEDIIRRDLPPMVRESDVPFIHRADGDDVVELQQLDLTLSMGPGTLIDDYVEATTVKFDMAFLRAITRSPYARLKLVTGIGDSMYPTLNGGDVIMIDTTDRQLAKQDGIYWISLYGAAGLKRLRTIGPGRVLVKSDNQTVGDQEVSAKDLRIEGRAVWFARGL